MKRFKSFFIASLFLVSCSSGGGGARDVPEAGPADGGPDPGRQDLENPRDSTQNDLAADEGGDDSWTEEGPVDFGPADTPFEDRDHATHPDDHGDDLQDSAFDRADESADPGTADVHPDNFGFEIRLPKVHTVSCAGPFGTETLDQMDMDWLCTFEHAETSGYVYLQATATGCKVVMEATPIFSSPGAWISINGKVTPLGSPSYDWGGNHHNDFMEFDYGGKHYKYYHSSFGFGWRACQPMDCLQVYNLGGATPIEDGCTPERLLPVVCVPIKADGTYDPLVDQFEKCPGDPNR